MSHTVEDVRHRIKRLRELADPTVGEDPHVHFKMGDMDCEFMVKKYDELLSLLSEVEKHHQGAHSEIGSKIRTALKGFVPSVRPIGDNKEPDPDQVIMWRGYNYLDVVIKLRAPSNMIDEIEHSSSTQHAELYGCGFLRVFPNGSMKAISPKDFVNFAWKADSVEAKDERTV